MSSQTIQLLYYNVDFSNDGLLLLNQQEQQLTRHDVARAVSLIGAAREEASVVALLNHHKGDWGAVLRVGVPHPQAGSRQLHNHKNVYRLKLRLVSSRVSCSHTGGLIYLYTLALTNAFRNIKTNFFVFAVVTLSVQVIHKV